jgi:hypothetical protein
MKKFDYSKIKTFNTALFNLRIFSLVSCVSFLFSGTFGILMLLFSIYFFLYSYYLRDQVLSIIINNESITVIIRKYLFKKELYISADEDTLQRWEYKYFLSSKENIYSINRGNSIQLIRITPLDYWEKETIEDLIVEVQRIGIPLKGNLSESIQVQKDKDCPSKNEENA